MATLAEGKKAPAFKGIDQDGKAVSSADFKGQKMVLYFYPQDNTPTCTEQACNLRDNYALLKKKGYVIIGVSPDEAAKHKKFETKFKLPFTLIADTDKKIITKYGLWAEKQMYGKKYMGVLRTTFVIDENGYIRKIIQKPKVKQHAEEILAAMQDT
jgi:peroxiredoxin Q/BCP